MSKINSMIAVIKFDIMLYKIIAIPTDFFFQIQILLHEYHLCINYMGITHICQYGYLPYCIFTSVILMDFPRIRDLREDADKKQNDLAKYLGIDQSTYSDYERGKICVPIDQLIKIADLYNVSLDYLVGRDDVPNRK